MTLQTFPCITNTCVRWIRSSSCAGTGQEDAYVFNQEKVWRCDSNLFRKLRAMIAIRSWIVLTAVFASCSLAAAADIPKGKPQIQGGNLRIEFDNRLRSRVVARFDKTETVMGPFTASETVTTAGKIWTGFLLTSQTRGRTKDLCGRGRSNCAASRTATIASWTTSPEKAVGRCQDPAHISRLSSTEICSWKCGHNERRCTAFTASFGGAS